MVLNTEHDVNYYPLSANRVHSRSYSTRIAEVEGPGERDERELPVGAGGTAFCGVCIPTGGSRSATAACTWNARPSR